MNDVEAASEGFCIDQLYGDEPARADLASDSELRKKSKPQPALDHTFGSFDGIDLQCDVWNQPRAAEETVGQGPVAGSAFVENERPTCGALQTDAAGVRGTLLRVRNQ